MSDVNEIYLIGHLGGDPDIRETAGGKRVVNVTVATSYMDNTQWHRCVIWGKNADYAADYLRKGSHVYVSGRMTYRDWTDKEGHKRTSAEISVNRINGLGKGDRGSTGHTETPIGNSKEETSDGFDDIPF
jgi:single-strand DNA-binding protein